MCTACEAGCRAKLTPGGTASAEETVFRKMFGLESRLKEEKRRGCCQRSKLEWWSRRSSCERSNSAVGIKRME